MEDGSLDIGTVDEATRRVLRAKFDMGLFEDPFPASPPEDWHKLIHTVKSLDLAEEIDRESIVLLENHSNILPLSSSAKKIAVIGPMANVMNVSRAFIIAAVRLSNHLC